MQAEQHQQQHPQRIYMARSLVLPWPALRTHSISRVPSSMCGTTQPIIRTYFSRLEGELQNTKDEGAELQHLTSALVGFNLRILP